jgi:hypothetical protein
VDLVFCFAFMRLIQRDKHPSVWTRFYRWRDVLLPIQSTCETLADEQYPRYLSPSPGRLEYNLKWALTNLTIDRQYIWAILAFWRNRPFF